MIKNNFFKLTPNKGNVGDVQVNMFDKIRDCIGVECPLAPKCGYVEEKLKKGRKTPRIKERHRRFIDKHWRHFDPGIHEVDKDGEPVIDGRNGKLKIKKGQPPKRIFVYGDCLLEKKYMTAVTKPFIDLIGLINDPFVVQWVGMHLVPLYHDLVVLKMEKLRILDGDQISYEDDKGTKKIHPIFDELRKAHAEIFKAWKTTGLLKIAANVGYFQTNRIPTVGDGADTEFEGDGNFVDELSGG